MNRLSTWTRRTVIGTCGLAAACAAEMPSYLDAYDWRARIGGEMISGRTYKVLLPADVYDGCRSFPLDIKVVDTDGREFPCIIRERAVRGHIDPVRFSDRKVSGDDADRRYRFREYRVEADASGNPAPLHNRVIVNIDGSQVMRQVEVWGGNDVNSLEQMGEGVVVEQKSPFPIRMRSIDYPETQVPLVQIRVFDDLRNTNAPLDWRASDILHVVVDDEDTENVQVEKMNPPDGESDPAGTHSAYLDTGAQNRQLLYLDIETSADDFAIPVVIYGRNEATNGWRWVVEGGIHDLSGKNETRINLPRTDFRFLKAEFRHGREKSPRFSKFAAGAAPHYLVFTAHSDEKAYLYFGSNRYQLPTVEISRGISRRTIAEAEEVTLSARHINPTRVASTLNRYGKTLLNLGIGIVVLLGAVVTVRILRGRLLPGS